MAWKFRKLRLTRSSRCDVDRSRYRSCHKRFGHRGSGPAAVPSLTLPVAASDCLCCHSSTPLSGCSLRSLALSGSAHETRVKKLASALRRGLSRSLSSCRPYSSSRCFRWAKFLCTSSADDQNNTGTRWRQRTLSHAKRWWNKRTVWSRLRHTKRPILMARRRRRMRISTSTGLRRFRMFRGPRWSRGGRQFWEHLRTLKPTTDRFPFHGTSDRRSPSKLLSGMVWMGRDLQRDSSDRNFVEIWVELTN